MRNNNGPRTDLWGTPETICGEKGEEITKTIYYKLKFIDIARFLASSLSSLSVISLKEFIKLNVNTGMIIKNAKRVELSTKVVSAVLNTQMLKII